MSHSLNKIWVHAVIRTKNSYPFINEKLEKPLHSFLKDKLIETDCYVKAINGITDHVHLLFLLSPKHSISDVMQKIKGSSSHWINKEKLTRIKFEWQTGYASFSVSEFYVEKVDAYIKRQKEHHGINKLTEEEELLTLSSLITP